MVWKGMSITVMIAAYGPCLRTCSESAARRAASGATASSALDDVDRQAALAGLLVLGRHVETGLSHGLDHGVERHEVRTVAVQGEAGGRHGRRGGDRIALDARDL